MSSLLPITPARVSRLMADLRPDAHELARTPKPGCVEGAISNALQAAHYHSDAAVVEPDPLHVAAYLLRSLAQNHCFEDGNKRLAWAAMLEILWVHAGLTLAADQEEAAELVLRVTTRQLEVDALIGWLLEHLVPAPGMGEL